MIITMILVPGISRRLTSRHFYGLLNSGTGMLFNAIQRSFIEILLSVFGYCKIKHYFCNLFE